MNGDLPRLGLRQFLGVSRFASRSLARREDIGARKVIFASESINDKG